MEVNNGKKSDSIEKKWKKKVIQMRWIYYAGKLTLKRFGLKEPSLETFIKTETF